MRSGDSRSGSDRAAFPLSSSVSLKQTRSSISRRPGSGNTSSFTGGVAAGQQVAAPCLRLRSIACARSNGDRWVSSTALHASIVGQLLWVASPERRDRTGRHNPRRIRQQRGRSPRAQPRGRGAPDRPCAPPDLPSRRLRHTTRRTQLTAELSSSSIQEPLDLKAPFSDAVSVVPVDFRSANRSTRLTER